MLTYEEYQSQSKAFCDALEQLKQEVAQKRSDLAAVAKQTVVDLEPKIPALQAQINTLTSEVARLEGLAVTTAKQSEYDKNYWNTQYLNLREGLEKIHQERMEALDVRQSAQDNRDTVYQGQVADLQSREQSLVVAKEQFIADLEVHDNSVKNFEKSMVIREDKARKIMDDLNGHINEANAEKLKQKAITAGLESKANDLADATKKAMNTVDRINEAQVKLDAAQKILDESYAKEESLKSQAEALEVTRQEIKEKNVILANRSSRLDQQEARLHQRTRHVCSLEEQRQIVEGEKNARAAS